MTSKKLPPHQTKTKIPNTPEGRQLRRVLVAALYRENPTMPINEMERRTNIAGVTIRKIYQELGLERCAYRGVEGADHPSWKGGRRMTSDGYIDVVISRHHPFHCMRKRDGYVREHRLVMAEALGRPLTTQETVHHKDGDRANNQLGNLQLMAQSGGHPRGQPLVCQDCGSHNIVGESL